MFVQCASYFHDVNIPWNINITANDLHNVELTNTLITHLASYPTPERGIEVLLLPYPSESLPHLSKKA